LNSSVHELNYLSDFLATEGDLIASWRVQVTQATRLAFRTHPIIREESESGPPVPITSSFDKTIDHYFSFTHNGVENCIAAGEGKKWGVIDAEAWRGQVPLSTTQEKLGKELRA
jgi:hypothetical protein